jgi:hypothetical protein
MQWLVAFKEQENDTRRHYIPVIGPLVDLGFAADIAR